MGEVTKATVRAEVGCLQEMMRKAALKSSSGDVVHSEVYVSVGGGEARFLASKSDNSIISYSTFGDGFLESVEVKPDTLTEENDRTMGAIVSATDFLDRLSEIEEDSGYLVDIVFTGNPDERLCKHLEFHGTEPEEMTLATSTNNLDYIPFEVTERFDEAHSWITSNGEPLTATIEAETRDIERIINIINEDAGLKSYPVTIRDNELYINTGKNRVKNAAWGVLKTNRVSGPDLTNYYPEEFENVFSPLSGEVRLETEKDMPLCAVYEQDGQVVRHVLGPVDG
jgi:hypothetical protein